MNDESPGIDVTARDDASQTSRGGFNRFLGVNPVNSYSLMLVQRPSADERFQCADWYSGIRKWREKCVATRFDRAGAIGKSSLYNRPSHPIAVDPTRSNPL